MRLRLRHSLRLHYPEPVRNVMAILRLTPRSHDGQRVTNWRIDVDPDCLLKAGEDHFGNLVHTLTLPGLVSDITITAQGELAAFDAAGIVRGSAERLPVELYLRETALTAPDDALRAFAARATEGAETRLSQMHRLMAAVHEAVAVDADLRGVEPAAEVFRVGHGTARAHAQLFAACARTLNVPARCAAGYYLADDAGAQRHSWAEAHVEGLGWVGFDTAHDICPQDHHVRVAIGLDAAEADSLRGAFGATPDESVAVKWLFGRDPGPLAAASSG